MDEHSATQVRVNFGRSFPVFPLEGVVLLPHAMLRLYIFEPRYQQMLEDVLDGSGQIAMAVLDESDVWSDEYVENPRIRPAVCVGQVAQHERLGDGTYRVWMQGVCRARVVEEFEPEGDRLYRQATLEPLEPGDREDDETDLVEERFRLLDLIRSEPLSGVASVKHLIEQLNEQAGGLDALPTGVLLEVVALSVVGSLNEPRTMYRLLAEGDQCRRAKIIERKLLGLRGLLSHVEKQWDPSAEGDQLELRLARVAWVPRIVRGLYPVRPMLTSVRWLNRYLDPADLSADEAVRVLEATSFPIESREDRADGDAVLDVEVTSNRGDCLCHLGLAREIASVTGRELRIPSGALPGSGGGGGAVASETSVENRVTDVCPRFTARMIRGVKIGPSPAWMVEALESVGQRSINNVVDVSNFVLLELGYPSHTFDLGTLGEGRLVVRYASEGEALTALDGKKHALRGSDLVVADAGRAVSLAGVIGGLDTGVTDATTDVLLEVATWNPLVVRGTARRLGITTDAGYRFERIVDARDLDWASARAAALILEVAGGELVEGMIDEGGRAAEDRLVLELRAARCEHLLGKAISVEEMERLLGAVGFEVGVAVGGAVLRCGVPHFRPDVTREIDLIEEVARLHGMDNFEIAPRLEVPLEIDHPAEWEAREHVDEIIGEVLTGSGFYETVTFSFATESEVGLFMEGGLRAIKVDEDRRRETPYLRASCIPSLLTCRRANQDGNVAIAGGVRLYEVASTFAEKDDGAAHGRETVERRRLAMLMDGGGKAEGRQAALREMRGAIEAVVRRVGGKGRRVEVRGIEDARCAGQRGGSFAEIVVDGERVLGWIGIPSGDAIGAWGLDQPVVAAELEVGCLMALHPAIDEVESLPAYPAIERDLSLVVDEGVAWARLEGVVGRLGLEMLEGVEFVGVFRGKQVGGGKKSVTMRLRFRSDERTLRHEEVDGQVAGAVKALEGEVGATLRV